MATSITALIPITATEARCRIAESKHSTTSIRTKRGMDEAMWATQATIFTLNTALDFRVVVMAVVTTSECFH
jgi:hypothetical protein